MTEDRMITRDKAIETLQGLIDSGILSDEIDADLNDIVSCIQAEKYGRHEWGTLNEETIMLYVARREDLWTEDLIKQTNDIDHKLRFIPSVSEMVEMVEFAEEELFVDLFEEGVDMSEDIEEYYKPRKLLGELMKNK